MMSQYIDLLTKLEEGIHKKMPTAKVIFRYEDSFIRMTVVHKGWTLGYHIPYEELDEEPWSISYYLKNVTEEFC